MRGSRSMSRVFLVSLVLGMTALACTRGGDEGEPSDGAGQPRRGGDLVFLHLEPAAPNLDKLRDVTLGVAWPAEQIMETLTRIDGEGNTVPNLAESWEVSEDNLTWTFTLREGVRFSDGTPLTADDVVFSLNDVMRNESLYRYLFTPIESVEATDDSTVAIRLRHPDPALAEALTVYGAGIIPADWRGRSEEQFYESPIGTGPFMLDPDQSQWVRGTSIRLVRNPNYWQEGKPYLDSVTFKGVPDENQRILQVQGEQAHISSFLEPSQATVALENTAGLTVEYIPAYFIDVLVLSQTYDPLTDVHVRRAIAYSINKEEIIESILFGRGEPGGSYLPPEMQLYDADAGLPHDPAKAEEEMAQSKFASGFDLEFLISQGATQSAVAQIMQQDLAPLGINVSIRQMDEGAKIEAELAGEFEMAIQGYGMVTGDPHEMTGAVVDPAILNAFFSGYQDPALVELANRAQAESDPGTREQLYSQVQEAVGEAAFVVPLFYPRQPFVVSDQVNGFELGLAYSINLVDAWLAS